MNDRNNGQGQQSQSWAWVASAWIPVASQNAVPRGEALAWLLAGLEKMSEYPPSWENFPSSCAEARRIASPYYFTGCPCPRGHVDLRTAHRGECRACHAEDAARWYRQHPEAWRESERLRKPR